LLAKATQGSDVVNRFKKNVSLHVETTIDLTASLRLEVVNRFKKNVSLHVETTLIFQV